MESPTFAAIDFETADTRPMSACAIGVVRVVNGTVVDRFESLIRTPMSSFKFTRLHGINRSQTEAAPPFAEVWRRACGLLEGVAFVAAHHAAFDLKVLHCQCMRSRMHPPVIPFVCTHLLAEQLCGAGNGRLSVACTKLGIALRHHDPLSDAEASASIVLAALARGIPVRRRT